MASLILLERPPLMPVVAALLHEDHVWFEDRWMVASFCDE
jgi:hypothetical protein